MPDQKQTVVMVGLKRSASERDAQALAFARTLDPEAEANGGDPEVLFVAVEHAPAVIERFGGFLDDNEPATWWTRVVLPAEVGR